MQNLKKPILIPLALVLAALFILLVATLYWGQRQIINRELAFHLKDIQEALPREINKEAQYLRSTLEILSRDTELMDLFIARDRQGVLDRLTPVFEKLKAYHNITHFYLSDARRVNFLRVHRPERYGDIIERFTTLEAEKTQKLSSGPELGPLGTFTLRTVMPWYNKNNLIGYLELGKEMGIIINNTRKMRDVDFYVLIEKRFLNRQGWEEGMQVLGRKPDWDNIPSSVIVYRTKEEIPEQIVEIPAAVTQQKDLSYSIPLRMAGEYYRATSFPLLDAGKRQLGYIVSIYKITPIVMDALRSIFFMGIIFLVSGGALFILFYLYMGKIEWQLASARTRLIEESRRREELQRQRAEEFQKTSLDLEDKVRDRTKELEIINKMLHSEIGQRKEMEELTKTMLDNVVIGVSMISPKMEILWLNKTFQKWFPQVDTTKKPLCYQAFYSPPKDKICDYCPTIKAFKEGKFHAAETGVCTNGRIYNVNAVPVKDFAGNILYVVETVEDITERRQAEEKIFSAAKEWSTTFDSMADGVSIHNADFAILNVNTRLCDMLGKAKEELIGKKCYQVFHGEDSPISGCPFIKSQSSCQQEYVETFEPGLSAWFSISTSPICNEKGEVIKVVHVLYDITERKRDEERQKAMTLGLRAVMEMADTLIGCADVDTLFKTAVELARSKLGLERCAIFVEEKGHMRGTYGTDKYGHTTDEHTQIFPKNESWDKYSHLLQSHGPKWFVIEEPYVEWDGQKTLEFGQGWIAITPMQSAQEAIGVFVNDTAIAKSPLDEVKQELVSVFCSMLGNITERKRAEEALKESEIRFRLAFENAQDAIIWADTQTSIIINCNHAAEELFGKTKNEIIGQHQTTLHPTEKKDFYAKIFEGHVKNLMGSIEAEIVTKSGGIKMVTITPSSTLVEGKKVIQKVFHDITERKQSEEEREILNKELLKSNERLKQLTLRDSHTGLYNHRYLTEIIEAEFYRAKRYSYPLSVIMLDIDYFKSVNDVYGHHFGDSVLKQLAEQLKKKVRRYDIVVRFGGEEFIIISPNTDMVSAFNLAQRILEAINLSKFGNKEHTIRLKASLAVASYPEDLVAKGINLIELVDEVLNKVKEFGGNRVYSSLDMANGKSAADKKSEEQINTKSLKEKLDKLTKRANQSLIEAVFAFAKTIEVKDHYTGEHVEMTVHYAIEIAKGLNFSAEQTEYIRQAAVLHDLGKIGISEKILLKKSKLSQEEFEEIKKHPQIGADIIRPIHFLHTVIPFILYHHERWDGQGYPSNLKKEEIPVGARILALADTYQALTSDRPYRKAYPKDKAIEIIESGSGTQFDPVIVNLFLKILQNEK